MTEFKYGQRVKFKAESLGIVDPEIHPHKFIAETVGLEDEGEVQTLPGEMAPALPEWMAVAPDKYPNGYVPVHPDMIEPV
jgi:hypothetical protein